MRHSCPGDPIYCAILVLDQPPPPPPPPKKVEACIDPVKTPNFMYTKKLLILSTASYRGILEKEFALVCHRCFSLWVIERKIA